MSARATLTDVAREAGVAISTASAALNSRSGVAEATRVRVRETAERLGFVPSIRGRSLVGGKSFAVGMVLEREPRVLEADPFFWGFIGGVESVINDHGFSFVLQTGTDAGQMAKRLRRLVLGGKVDGVFLADSRVDDPRYPLVAELDVPTVALNVAAALSPVPTVRQDHGTAMRELIRRVLELGHTRIAHVSGTPGYVHSVEREHIWRTTLGEAGLAADLLFQGDFSIESGKLAAYDLLNRDDPPTAVVCVNDLCAVGFLSGARALGVHVPSDVSLAGYEGIELGAYTTPALTTVVTAPYELGVHAARLLLALIDGGAREDVTISPASLLWRDSVVAPHVERSLPFRRDGANAGTASEAREQPTMS